MKVEWISVKEKLPKESELFLVLTVDSILPALAIFKSGYWEVQPFRASWYMTKDGITHWQALVL